jgi:cysteinyl-tRNA synthetase
VAEEFAQAYRDDTDKLGLGRPDVEPLATEHIDEIVDLISALIENGHAYQAGLDVYFDVDSWQEYGKLSKQQVAEMRHGARIDVTEDKADPLDFALWKGAKPGEPAWESPWGPGRPGWHIECSAMSLKYLNAGFDIHGGGRDLIFPHHENEVAQAEGALNRPYARFWMHNGMLNLKQEKMSKSLGNILTLRHILEVYRPQALIIAFLGSHYRSPLEFSSELLDETEQQVDRLRNVFRALAEYSGPGSDTQADRQLLAQVEQRRTTFDEALADDLNTAAALAELFALVRDVNSATGGGVLSTGAASTVRKAMVAMARVLGLDSLSSAEDSVPADILAMAEERQQARASKDFARADSLRNTIADRGYEVRDAPDGFKVVATR